MAVREAQEKLAESKRIVLPPEFVRTVCMPAPRSS